MSMRGRTIENGIIFIFSTVILWTVGPAVLGDDAFWLFFAVSAALLFAINFNQVASEYRMFYLLGFFVHVGLLFYQSTMQNLPMCGGDWPVFVRQAQTLLSESNGVLSIINPLTGGYDAYERLCALTYSVFGFNQKYMYFLSFIAAEICFSYIYRTALIISDDFRISSITCLVFYFTPIELVYSVDFLREMVIQALLIVSFYYFTQYMLYRKQSKFLVASLLAIILSLFHSGMVGVLIGYITVVILTEHRTYSIKLSPIRIAFVAFVVFALYNSSAWNLLAARFSNIDSAEALLTRVNGATVNTTYIGSPASVGQLIMQIPLRFVYYLLSPLPWQVRSVSGLIAMILDSTVRWVIAFRSCKLLFNRNIEQEIGSDNLMMLKACIIVLIATTLVFSWGTNNYGTAMRHRSSLYPIEVLVYISIWSRRNGWRQEYEETDTGRFS